jgi:hypothetical protein
MLEPLTRKAAAVPLVLLTLFLIARGVLPAWQKIDTDFPNYYTAGRIVLEGTGVERLYDDAWFQTQIARYGMELQGKFSPFPPPTALVFVPLAAFGPMTALRIMTVINLLLLAIAIVVLSRIMVGRIWESALLILLSGLGLANCIRFGQLYIALSLCLLLGYLLHRRGSLIAAGIAYGLMLPIKYVPVVFLLYYCWKREWRVVVSTLATAALVTLISIAVLGWDIHRQFLSSVLGGHLQGMLTRQDPFSSTFQSFDSLLRRLFVADPARNSQPALDLPVLYPVLKAVIAAAVILLMVRTVGQLRQPGQKRDGFVIALALISALLLAPATATYHMLILWLPVGLLLSVVAAHKETASGFWWILALYSLIGFIPYSLFAPFDLRGPLAFLAYPRLWLLVALFAVTVASATRWARMHRSAETET